MLGKLKGEDKILHSKIGNLIYVFTFIFLLPFVSITHSLVISLIILFLIALTKELYDKYIKKTYIDWWDIIAAYIPYPITKHINKMNPIQQLNFANTDNLLIVDFNQNGRQSPINITKQFSKVYTVDFNIDGVNINVTKYNFICNSTDCKLYIWFDYPIFNEKVTNRNLDGVELYFEFDKPTVDERKFFNNITNMKDVNKYPNFDISDKSLATSILVNDDLNSIEINIEFQFNGKMIEYKLKDISHNRTIKIIYN